MNQSVVAILLTMSNRLPLQYSTVATGGNDAQRGQRTMQLSTDDGELRLVTSEE